jgi:outer membrane protein TolC
VRNPFQSIDHVRFSRKKAADNLSANRIVPSANITGKKALSLEDCRNLALTRNLEIQAARVEELTKAALRDSRQKRILPHLIFNAQLSERDNYRYAFSDVLGQEGRTPSPTTTGTGVINYSVGRERNTWRYTMELNWSPNDAALAYFLAKNGENERLRAHYQKVRVAQKLIGAVEAAFFRLLGLQERVGLAKELERIRSSIFNQVSHLKEKGMKSAEDYQRARSDSIRAGRLLNSVRTELEKQREILASAMALSPHCNAYDGFSACGKLWAPSYRESIPTMEMIAVKNRPESYVAGLNLINSMNDVKRSIIKLFPKLSGFWRYTRDNDRYLYNKDWKEVGLNINFDLTKFWSEMDESRAASAGAMKNDSKTGITAITIASEVRSAALQYIRALKEVESSRSSLENAMKYHENMKIKSQVDDIPELELDRSRAAELEERMAWKRALGEANAALAQLNEAMGLNYRQPAARN